MLPAYEDLGLLFVLRKEKEKHSSDNPVPEWPKKTQLFLRKPLFTGAASIEILPRMHLYWLKSVFCCLSFSGFGLLDNKMYKKSAQGSSNPAGITNRWIAFFFFFCFSGGGVFVYWQGATKLSMCGVSGCLSMDPPPSPTSHDFWTAGAKEQLSFIFRIFFCLYIYFCPNFFPSNFFPLVFFFFWYFMPSRVLFRFWSKYFFTNQKNNCRLWVKQGVTQYNQAFLFMLFFSVCSFFLMRERGESNRHTLTLILVPRSGCKKNAFCLESTELEHWIVN